MDPDPPERSEHPGTVDDVVADPGSAPRAAGGARRPRNEKAAQRIARRIETDILGSGKRPGDRLGSEPELMERYGTSRTLFREAVRMLEHDGICDMRRGPSGGLHVREIDAEAVARLAALRLHFTDTTIDDLHEVRLVLEPRCAALAAERIDGDAAGRLRDFLDIEAAALASGDRVRYVDAVNDFHVAIAAATTNPVAELFVRVLTQLNRHDVEPGDITTAELADAHRMHEELAEAIISGDAPLAAHRATIHMRGIRDFRRNRGAASTDEVEPTRVGDH